MNTLDYAPPAQKSVLKSVAIFIPNPILFGVAMVFGSLHLPEVLFYTILSIAELATIFAIFRWRKELYLFVIIAGITLVIIGWAFWLSLPYWPTPGD